MIAREPKIFDEELHSLKNITENSVARIGAEPFEIGEVLDTPIILMHLIDKRNLQSKPFRLLSQLKL